MTAYDRLVARFSERPQINCWSPTEYRVVMRGWHMHDGACAAAPMADGKTLEAACEELLRQVERPEVELVAGACDQQCENRYDDSPKSRLAHRRLWDFIERTAAEVDRWPAWKRRLPPCPSNGCNMATGHPGECE